MREKSILLVGMGLASEVALYCMLKRLKEIDDISVVIDRISLGSKKEVRNNIRACFYIHRFLDEFLTPAGTDVSYELSVQGWVKRGDSLNYDLKVFGSPGVTSAHDRIDQVSCGMKERYYPGKTFCNRLVHYGRDLYANLRYRVKIDEHGEQSFVRWMGDRGMGSGGYDLILIAEPAYRVLDDIGEDYLPTLQSYPIGLTVLNNTAGYDNRGIRIIYDVSESSNFYRMIIDPIDDVIIKEYSLAYKNNYKQVYNGGIISPGKIIKNGMAEAMKLKIAGQHPNVHFIGRYAKWDPNNIIADAYDECVKIVEYIFN